MAAAVARIALIINVFDVADYDASKEAQEVAPLATVKVIQPVRQRMQQALLWLRKPPVRRTWSFSLASQQGWLLGTGA